MRRMLGWILTLSFIVSPTAQAETITPNDPLFSEQSYHALTKVHKVWAAHRENKKITIAVIDTGVDLDHPDLKQNLVQGYNLIDSTKPPEDDNGHGTAAIGILAAHGNNKTGITGVLWNANVMPIKVLDSKGNASAEIVAKAIQLATDKGARIILLSLGDPIYSTELERAAAYAESKGVLLIGATGNDSSRVIYPAAFPTVLAVGAVDSGKRTLPYSNRGPEIDLVGPGFKIQTTGLGGTYTTISGTSMAAPQIAGIAALLLNKNPNLTPLQIRMILQSTAEDLETSGWDLHTGYGLVDAERALSGASNPPSDIYEPNQHIGESASLPIIAKARAILTSQDTEDWYRIDVPYDGSVKIKVTPVGEPSKDMVINLYNQHQKRLMTAGELIEMEVPKGHVYVQLQSKNSERQISYDLQTSFSISKDRHENNDIREAATKLSPAPISKVVGNFHRTNDADWYSAYYPWAGSLDLQITTDTLRMDPVLTIEQADKWREVVDDGSTTNKQLEKWSARIQPGSFFYEIRNYYQQAVNGEYSFQIRYQPDPSKQFKDITAHWARTHIEEIAAKKWITGYSSGRFEPDRVLTRAEAAAIIQRILSLPSGQDKRSYTDLSLDHWAFRPMTSLVEQGIIQPAADNRVHPDQGLTRAELATMIYRAKYGNSPPSPQAAAAIPPFTDMRMDHWAYPYIYQMWKQNLIVGVSTNRFGPEQLTTRAEFVTLVARMW
jgi:serine protease